MDAARHRRRQGQRSSIKYARWRHMRLIRAAAGRRQDAQVINSEPVRIPRGVSSYSNTPPPRTFTSTHLHHTPPSHTLTTTHRPTAHLTPTHTSYLTSPPYTLTTTTLPRSSPHTYTHLTPPLTLITTHSLASHLTPRHTPPTTTRHWFDSTGNRTPGIPHGNPAHYLSDHYVQCQ